MAFSLAQLLAENGFDSALHERLRERMRAGEIGLVENQMPADVEVKDADPGDAQPMERVVDAECRALGQRVLANGEVAVVTLAGGVGSRWSRGAGVVKALYPFHELGGRDRSFLEVHLAKTHRTARRCGTPLPHIITTSYLTHEPIERHLDRYSLFGYEGPVLLSRGQSVGLRMVPMLRDLFWAWSQPCDVPLDEAARGYRQRMVAWVQRAGPGSDYVDNTPLQCLHPLGHWFEWASLLRNGTLKTVLDLRPQLRYLLLHNIDTLGADVDPGLLGWHIREAADLTYEVIPRRPGDRGGGLARVAGRVLLVEGLTLPARMSELGLSLYNTMTTWITVDRLLQVFGLTRQELSDRTRINDAVRRMADEIPTYVTLKDVRHHNRIGADEIYPVVQCEKLWSDMSALPGLTCRYVVVPYKRGQQLKQLSHIERWRSDGSAQHVEELCVWR